MRKRGGQAPIVKPEFEWVADDAILGSTIWTNDDGTHVERFQVLQFRDGKIADMQGFATRRQADRYCQKLTGSGGRRP
jgi:hypothetical protein